MTAGSTINRFSSLATDPLRSFRFYVEFSPKGSNKPFDSRLATGTGSPATSGKSTGWVGGFSNISGLNITTQAIQYREGGYNTTVHQIPGMTTFSPITMQRGVLYGNDQAITWMRGLFAAAAGDGLAVGPATDAKTFRMDLKIYVMDHPNAGPTDANVPKMGFHVHNAWISGLNYTDLNANDGSLLFESLNLVHEGLTVFFTDKDFKPISGGAGAPTAAGTTAV